jgi:hypothetical protein
MAGCIYYEMIEVSTQERVLCLDTFFINTLMGTVFPHVTWKNLVYIELDGAELRFAIEHLGATPMKRAISRYYGDEAKRILFNWN